MSFLTAGLHAASCRSSKSFRCLASPEEHKHRKIYERKEWKSRKVPQCFTCGPGKPIFPGGPSKPCGERDGWEIAVCSDMSVYCISPASWVDGEARAACCFLLKNLLCMQVGIIFTLLNAILWSLLLCLHSLTLWIFPVLYINKNIQEKKSDFLPPCPLTPSLLLDRQALSLPETQDSCHFTNRGQCNTARQP